MPVIGHSILKLRDVYPEDYLNASLISGITYENPRTYGNFKWLIGIHSFSVKFT
jgi:hypothetical protein